MKTPPMSERRRAQMLLIGDGVISIPHYLYYLDRLTRCDEVLDFLIREKLIGQKLADCIQFEHGNSVLRFAQWAIMKLDHEKKMKPIIAGKDFQLR